jgi:hypothetical protein
VGNHDQTPGGGGSSASTTKYNAYFGVSRFDGRYYYGGHYGSDNNNHYELFSAGGMDFIVIHFEYDTTPEQEVLDWADNLLSIYSNRRAIVSTHYLIGLGNPASFGTQGQAIYDALSDHENLFLMLAGHIHGEGRRQDTAINGNVVNTLLSDYQDYPNGGDGYLRIMTFSPANNTIQVETYSPVLDYFETDDSSEFTLNYDMDGGAAIQVIGAAAVPSGANASIPWPDLDDNTEYEWYVTVDDGYSVTTGNTWRFTTSTSGAPVEATVSFQQGVDGYTSTVDTFIMESDAVNRNAAEAWVEWDEDDPYSSGNSNFGLIRFDDLFGSGAGQIPPGATIESATLTYVVSNTGDAADIHEIVVGWTENVTYDGFGNDPGVQADEYGAAVGTASGSASGSQIIDVTASLIAWASEPSANYGWIFRPTGSNGVEFRSSEYGVTNERPLLEVTYTTDGSAQ